MHLSMRVERRNWISNGQRCWGKLARRTSQDVRKAFCWATASRRWRKTGCMPTACITGRPRKTAAKGDLIWSSRHQDFVMRVDYQDGTGTGNILWRMGNQGDFALNNVNNDR